MRDTLRDHIERQALALRVTIERNFDAAIRRTEFEGQDSGPLRRLRSRTLARLEYETRLELQELDQ